MSICIENIVKSIDLDRLLGRIEELARIGAIEGGGVCRLALTDEDKAGRDQVIAWMKALGLTVSVDQIGNVVGLRAGTEDGNPVMTGSHIDTVRTGGKYDGNLGVLAGLEVVAALNDANIVTKKPIAVAFFTNEEGARFAPDMMGSLVYNDPGALQNVLDTVGIDGTTVGDNLVRIGYAGNAPAGAVKPDAFIELHVEQGPVLEHEGITIGAVTGVQGIHWTEFSIEGQSNHAGTTPMALRHDAFATAIEIARYAQQVAQELGKEQLATVGHVNVKPNLVNVIPNKAVFTIDMRNTDEQTLRLAVKRVADYADKTASKHGTTLHRRILADFSPVAFDETMVALVESYARKNNYKVMRMPSGAGHDAQMFAPHCPTGMIFVPSVGGLSHNVKEFTHAADIHAGVKLLLSLICERAIIEKNKE